MLSKKDPRKGITSVDPIPSLTKNALKALTGMVGPVIRFIVIKDLTLATQDQINLTVGGNVCP
jgi:hypothetical protein